METQDSIKATEGRIAQFAITCAHCDADLLIPVSAAQTGPLFTFRCRCCEKYTAIGVEAAND